MAFMRCVALLLVMLAPACLKAEDALLATKYEHKALQITSGYDLYWTVDSTTGTLELAIQANTTGWVGFGIAESESGSMPGSDIVTATVNANGEVTATDRYAVAFALPAADCSQDWTVVAGSEMNGTTTVELSRPLDTGDGEDRALSSAVSKYVRVVVAFDNSNSDVFRYHSANRKAMKLPLFFNVGEDTDPVAALRTDPDVFEVVMKPSTSQRVFCRDMGCEKYLESEHSADERQGEFNPSLWSREVVQVQGASPVNLSIATLGDVRAASDVVLALHSFPTGSQYFYQMCEMLVREMGDGWACAAVDQRGYNTSSKPTDVEAYQLSHLVGDVAAVAEALAPLSSGRRTHLLAHGFGASVAFAAVLADDARFSSLTAISGPDGRAWAEALKTSPAQLAKSNYIFNRIDQDTRQALEDSNFASWNDLFEEEGQWFRKQAADYARSWNEGCDQGLCSGSAALMWWRANFVPSDPSNPTSFDSLATAFDALPDTALNTRIHSVWGGEDTQWAVEPLIAAGAKFASTQEVTVIPAHRHYEVAFKNAAAKKIVEMFRRVAGMSSGGARKLLTDSTNSPLYVPKMSLEESLRKSLPKVLKGLPAGHAASFTRGKFATQENESFQKIPVELKARLALQMRSVAATMADAAKVTRGRELQDTACESDEVSTYQQYVCDGQTLYQGQSESEEEVCSAQSVLTTDTAEFTSLGSEMCFPFGDADSFHIGCNAGNAGLHPAVTRFMAGADCSGNVTASSTASCNDGCGQPEEQCESDKESKRGRHYCDGDVLFRGTSSSADVCTAQSVQDTDTASFTSLGVSSLCYDVGEECAGDGPCGVHITCPAANGGVSPAQYRYMSARDCSGTEAFSQSAPCDKECSEPEEEQCDSDEGTESSRFLCDGELAYYASSSSADVCTAQSVQDTEIASFTPLPTNDYCFNTPACREDDPECSPARSVNILCPAGNVGVNPAIYRMFSESACSGEEIEVIPANCNTVCEGDRPTRGPSGRVDICHPPLYPCPDGVFLPNQVTEYVDSCYNVAHMLAGQQVAEGDEGIWHIVVFGVALSPATAHLVHHLTVHGSYDSDTCSGDVMLWGWAPGSSTFSYPDTVGLPVAHALTVGGSRAIKSIRVSTHMDKPALGDREGGLFDDSAVTMLITKRRRTHNAGLLQLGDGQVVMRQATVPSGISSMETTCPASCTSLLANPLLGSKYADGVNVFAVWFHMHQTGTSAYQHHYRGNKLLEETSNQVDYYDFSFQDINSRPEFKLEPGDSFKSMCAYDTSKAREEGRVQFGLESSDEMCIIFMLYYPEIEVAGQVPIQYCGAEGQCGGSTSRPISATTNTALGQRLHRWPHQSSCDKPPPAAAVTIQSTIKFEALDIAQFADSAFDTKFRTDFTAAVAAKASVPASQVEIVSITAGSVSVGSVVMFTAAEAANADTFTAALNADVAQIFTGNAFASYGDVTATRVVKSESTPSESTASGSVPLGTFTFSALVGVMATLSMMFDNGVF